MRTERESRHGKAAACPAINTVTRGGDPDRVASATPAIQSEQRDAYSLAEFATRHSISKSHLFDLMRSGLGPRVIKAGRRSLISAEAAADWRKQMEVAR